MRANGRPVSAPAGENRPPSEGRALAGDLEPPVGHKQHRQRMAKAMAFASRKAKG